MWYRTRTVVLELRAVLTKYVRMHDMNVSVAVPPSRCCCSAGLRRLQRVPELPFQPLYDESSL